MTLRKMQRRKHGKSTKRSPKPMSLTSQPPFKGKVAMINFVASDTFALTESAAGSGAQFFLSLNNAYDVLTAVGGPSATYFSAVTTMYRYYRVLSTRLRLEVIPIASSNGLVTVSMLPSPMVAVVPSNPKVWHIQPNAYTKTSVSSAASSGGRTMVLDRMYSMAKIFGIKESVLKAESDYRAVFNGSPANQAYCSIGVFGINSSTAATISGRYTVSFKVMFESPVVQSP